MIALRKPHLRRRTKPNRQQVEYFLLTLSEAKKKYDHRHIVNCDETSWPVVMSPKKTWTKKADVKSEQSEVVAKINGDPKQCFTIMASINMAGDGLPLYMIAKGKTERCESQLETSDNSVITHTETGWVTIAIMEKFLSFLRDLLEADYGLKKRKKMLLVMDVYAAHRNKEILSKAAQTYYIDLLFIPPGMTATLQPLDATIFGAMKSSGEGAWIKQYLIDPNQKFG
jgi:hypothetical protein